MNARKMVRRIVISLAMARSVAQPGRSLDSGLACTRAGRGYVLSMSEESDLARACAEAARCGGKVLRERFGGRRTIDYKGGIDLVTDADRASEEALLSFLGSRFPAAGILAEESGTRGSDDAPLRFVVDPLDGTTNYAHGLPHFAVNVAALDGRGVAAGATWDPVREEMFLAARGQGATLGGAPIHVSETPELVRALLCTGFPYDVHQNWEMPL